MNTIVTTITDHEFAALASGLKNFIVLRQKKEPLIGQRIILQEKDSAEHELEYRISDVHSEPGITKGYYILSFAPFARQGDYGYVGSRPEDELKAAMAPTKVQFDFNEIPSVGNTVLGPFGEEYDAKQLEDELPGLGDFGAENDDEDNGAAGSIDLGTPIPAVPTAIDDLPF